MENSFKILPLSGADPTSFTLVRLPIQSFKLIFSRQQVESPNKEILIVLFVIKKGKGI
jgi:hypothetical protein